MKRIIISVLLGFVGGISAFLITINWFLDEDHHSNENFEAIETSFQQTEPTTTNTSANKPQLPAGTDSFVKASEISTASVVFIQTIEEYEMWTGSMFDWFFEPRTSQRVGSGSGVILSEDGYIVTNSHVIEGADMIKVTWGKRSYDAELIGRDPSTDLAVIKINAKSLPALPMGSSKDVKVGQWVLAVGNPFNLTSTVTAGIVSAKGRNINILKDKFPIESFIQTDAAINPGNSGGALVNKDGELIGINTAILSRTGSYAGYGFAIPINIVEKVFNDMVKYGEVQKSFTGADYIDIDSELVEKLDLNDYNGVIVTNVQKKSAAEKAGLDRGDVIKKINGIPVESRASFEEFLAVSYPGDEIQMTVLRDGKALQKSMILTNREGTTGITKRTIYYSEYWEAQFEAVPKVERDLMGIASGIRVIDYKQNGTFSQLGIGKGFIITGINSTKFNDPQEFAKVLEKISGKFTITGIDSRGRKVYYPYKKG